MTQILYGATFRYGRPNLVRMEIEKTTPKMLFIRQDTYLLGDLYKGRRVHKDSFGLLTTDIVEALRYLRDRTEAHIEDHLENIDRLYNERNQISQLLKEAGQDVPE